MNIAVKNQEKEITLRQFDFFESASVSQKWVFLVFRLEFDIDLRSSAATGRPFSGFTYFPPSLKYRKN